MILAALLIGAAPPPALVTVPAHPVAWATSSPPGSTVPVLESLCTSADGRQFDMADVTLSVSNIKRIGSQYYTIEGDRILITSTPTERARAVIWDAYFLSHSTNRSVVIFHADLDGVPYIYWVEKIIEQRQLLRNGLLSIAGDRIAPACVGTIYR